MSIHSNCYMWRTEMIRKVFIVIILVSYTVSDGNINPCVRYTFEENFDKWLLHDWGPPSCLSGPVWMAGKYRDLDWTIDHNDLSTTFITPAPLTDQLSCVSSFIFTMHPGGSIEVNIYMENAGPSDQILVVAHRLEDPIVNIGNAWNTADTDGFMTLKLTLTNDVTDEGYVSIGHIVVSAFYNGLAYASGFARVIPWKYTPRIYRVKFFKCTFRGSGPNPKL